MGGKTQQTAESRVQYVIKLTCTQARDNIGRFTAVSSQNQHGI